MNPRNSAAAPLPLHGLPAFDARMRALGRASHAADAGAVALLLALMIFLGLAARQMVSPLSSGHAPPIDLAPSSLPMYTLRTVARMLVALLASLLFTFTYATWAAKSRRAEQVLIPLLDALQSVPVLGYLSFTVVFFLSLFPGSALGAELASIFAIFTAQAWNMAFSFYQSLRTLPVDLDEASRSLRETGWQRFWRLEVPFAIPGLLWNTMMSMSGSWFFVVASEAIAVGDTRIALPGIGSYVERAIEARNLAAIGWAIVFMSIAIVVYDQLLFRPLVVWADKFRVEQSAAQPRPASWALDLFSRSGVIQGLRGPVQGVLAHLARARLALPGGHRAMTERPRGAGDILWYGGIAALLVCLGWYLAGFLRPALSMSDLQAVALDGVLTLLRVIVLIALASVVWIPAGIAIGLRPRLTQYVQPVAQFLAAFPANLLFPVAVYLIVQHRLAPAIWLSPLMILGTQWYILFNVIAGASVFPTDLREAAASLRLGSWSKWRRVLLPGIFPYYVTGAITASGGAWNASIVSEAVSWGNTRLSTPGLGAYIAQQTAAGDYARITLGVAMMSALVVLMNRVVWRPLYALAERRTRLD
ncbi:MAG TPA: ABC transporter permease subunit [Steroidobacteraceae bacterium]|nr:ABC transporter permease subunit [Steroidobacteraceae bacterium]